MAEFVDFAGGLCVELSMWLMRMLLVGLRAMGIRAMVLRAIVLGAQGNGVHPRLTWRNVMDGFILCHFSNLVGEGPKTNKGLRKCASMLSFLPYSHAWVLDPQHRSIRGRRAPSAGTVAAAGEASIPTMRKAAQI